MTIHSLHKQCRIIHCNMLLNPSHPPTRPTPPTYPSYPARLPILPRPPTVLPHPPTRPTPPTYPAHPTCLAPSTMGTMHSGSVDWVDSSMRTIRKRNLARRGSPAPAHVQHTTSAFCKRRRRAWNNTADRGLTHCHLLNVDTAQGCWQ